MSKPSPTLWTLKKITHCHGLWYSGIVDATGAEVPLTRASNPEQQELLSRIVRDHNFHDRLVSAVTALLDAIDDGEHCSRAVFLGHDVLHDIAAPPAAGG